MVTTPEQWEDLIAEWDEIRHGYHLGDTHRTVLECARNVEESVAADGPDTALWVLGLVLIGPYALYVHQDAAAEALVLKAMDGVERALGQAVCTHEEHPCDDLPESDDELDGLRHVLEMLARPDGKSENWDETDSWFEGRTTREIWACPRNLAGFARDFS